MLVSLKHGPCTTSRRVLRSVVRALAGILLSTGVMLVVPLHVADAAAAKSGLKVLRVATPLRVGFHNGTKGWNTFQNRHAGYVVMYPASWTVIEHPEVNGSLVTEFRGSDSRGAGIDVTVTWGMHPPENTDIGNVQCQPLEVGRLIVTQCLDTLAFSMITTLEGPDKTYTFATSLKHTSKKTYQRLVRSFRLLT